MAKKMHDTLGRLSEELLAEEAPEQSPFPEDFFLEDDDTTPADLREPYRNFANGYRVRTNQPADVDLESYSRQVYEAKMPSNKPLVILALVLTLCILLVVAWWVWRLGGLA